MQVLEDYKIAPIKSKNQTATISIAVAVYNSDAYLERAIDSLLNQTYRNLEIILVDDGSTDNCPAICDKYAKTDERVRVFHKENGGLYTSRNVGIQQATGDYIAFLDGDDWVDPTMYENMLSALQSEDADMAICRYRCIYSDRIKDNSTSKAIVFERQEVLEQYLKDDENILIQNAAWNKLYKRSLIENLRFPSRWYEDMLYTIQLLSLSSKSIYLDRAYYNYVRDRNSSIMNQAISERLFSDQIPNLYDRSIFLREIGREDLALLQDYQMYKRLLLFYRLIDSSTLKEKKKYKIQLEKKIKAGRHAFPQIYGIAEANPNEYRKMKIFLFSPLVFRVVMWMNDKFILPIKLKRNSHYDHD